MSEKSAAEGRKRKTLRVLHYAALWDPAKTYYCLDCQKFRSFYWQSCIHCGWENPVLMREPDTNWHWVKVILGGIAFGLLLGAIGWGTNWLWGIE